jgi:IS30 family transposase
LATVNLYRPSRQFVHSITAYNGREFAYHEKIGKVLSAAFNFVYAYCSCERGLNENANGLRRQYFSKIRVYKLLTGCGVGAAVKRLNNWPGKTLGYRASEQLMNNYSAAVVA